MAQPQPEQLAYILPIYKGRGMRPFAFKQYEYVARGALHKTNGFYVPIHK